ncbi:DNA-directed RNA polymerase subunit alpha [Pyramidobacter sp. CG50-2]|nr:DNA-directed RNA polymerase subunit alpha [Pyramidobacter sp. CG50-2]
MEIMRPEIQVEECSSTAARLVIGPLERGYGQTIGNALRRVLLSSIKGAAISAVRVEGAQHEFTTIPGMKEDVIELLLNLKHVPVRSHSAEYRTLKLDVEGGKKVTAADFQEDSDIEFIDPDAYICTLAEGHSLSLEVYIEQGVGYATVDRPRPSYLPVDALMIDAIYSPILRVKYEVQNERVGQKTDYEKIVMNVTTNGVVAPDIAVAEAAKLLREYFDIVIQELRKLHPAELGLFDDESASQPSGNSQAGDGADNPPENALLNKPVRELELSIRSENCLLRGGIHTIGDLVSRSKDDLLKIRNLGKISLREIEEKMTKYGIVLSDDKASAENSSKED